MSTFAAIAACVILAALAVFQLGLILGAPIGHFAWGGQHRVLPTKLRVGSAVSIILYVLFALILLERAGLMTVFGSDPFVQVASWVLFGYFTLGILMNGISRSKLERNTMVPVTVVLAVLTLIVALG
ncbi:hypothetical protein ACX3O0_03765 [Homoserinimonas sp. A447]